MAGQQQTVGRRTWSLPIPVTIFEREISASNSGWSELSKLCLHTRGRKLKKAVKVADCIQINQKNNSTISHLVEKKIGNSDDGQNFEV